MYMPAPLAVQMLNRPEHDEVLPSFLARCPELIKKPLEFIPDLLAGLREVIVVEGQAPDDIALDEVRREQQLKFLPRVNSVHPALRFRACPGAPPAV